MSQFDILKLHKDLDYNINICPNMVKDHHNQKKNYLKKN
jgi:hypothetical protein